LARQPPPSLTMKNNVRADRSGYAKKSGGRRPPPRSGEGEFPGGGNFVGASLSMYQTRQRHSRHCVPLRCPDTLNLKRRCPLFHFVSAQRETQYRGRVIQVQLRGCPGHLSSIALTLRRPAIRRLSENPDTPCRSFLTSVLDAIYSIASAALPTATCCEPEQSSDSPARLPAPFLFSINRQCRRLSSQPRRSASSTAPRSRFHSGVRTRLPVSHPEMITVLGAKRLSSVQFPRYDLIRPGRSESR
jgi:hypothetical protein